MGGARLTEDGKACLACDRGLHDALAHLAQRRVRWVFGDLPPPTLRTRWRHARRLARARGAAETLPPSRAQARAALGRE